VETTRSIELKRSIDEQILLIKSYVDGFELFVPKDEAALGEIDEILKTAAQRIKEMDEARIKRKRLMGELNQAFIELEDSQKRFAKSVGTDVP
jgi:hypothetical protein